MKHKANVAAQKDRDRAVDPSRGGNSRRAINSEQPRAEGYGHGTQEDPRGQPAADP
jgi:hypothetical protein